MNTPKTDDFRLERSDEGLKVTFTPTGRTYTYSLANGELSTPSASSPQVNAADYAEEDIRRAAMELAKLAVSGGPKS